jgi:hypothetical protein
MPEGEFLELNAAQKKTPTKSGLSIAQICCDSF